MISADEALTLVLDNVKALGAERVALLAALGRTIAEDIGSPRDIPGFDNSAMDGYAVVAADTANATESHPLALTVLETVGAGAMPTRRVERGTAVRTMTGAPIAAGADAVIQVERTRPAGDSRVEVLASVQKGANIRPRGEDMRAGDTVISAGRVLTASDIGVIASVNRSSILVHRRPRVAIVSTGDELVDVDQVPTGAQIVNSSGYALAAAVAEASGDATILRVARDTEADVRAQLSEAMRFDAVLSTGGVSVGQFDHVKTMLDALAMRTMFHGVAQRPGKPLKFGIVDGRPVFGLPGNPVSTMVCFYLYARPAILKMAGRSTVGLPRIRVRCAVDIKKAANLTEFIRVRIEKRADGTWAAPTGNQGSGILSSLSRADALLVGPASEPVMREGSEACALLLNVYGAADMEPGFETELPRFQRY